MFHLLAAVMVRVAALQVLLGWLFSAASSLTPQAYLWVGLPATLVLVVGSFKCSGRSASLRAGARLGNWWRRRRWLPLAFVFTFGLIVLGALLREPNNFDGLSYRVPRTLFWLQHGRWTWIDTPYAALNHTMPNFEWVSLPLFLAGGTRPLVLINLVSFLAVPPLLFALLRRFRVNGRLAYDWMWIFPAGYIVAMQAGGIGNDLPGLAVILAALYFAIRFVEQGRGGDLFDALLAAGLVTGIKLSNLPLAVFVIIILLGAWEKLLARRIAWAAGVVFGGLVSALIPLALNFAHSGSILGTTTRIDQVDRPLAGVVGNVLILGASAVAPPLLPGAGRLSELAESGLGAGMLGWLRNSYPKFSLKLNELPQEEVGGLGLGVTLAVLVVLVLGRKRGGDDAVRSFFKPWQMYAWWLCLAGGGLYMLARLGTGPAVPRNLLPWAPLVLAPLLALRNGTNLGRGRSWKLVALFAAVSVWPALALTPSRPVIPPEIILGAVAKAGLKGRTLERAQVVYATYQQRSDPFAELRQELPATARKLGLVSDGNEPTASWMQPYGMRSCIYLRSAGEIANARATGVEFVVLKAPVCRAYFELSTEQWCEQFHARPIKAVTRRIHAAEAPVDFILVRFQP